MPRIEIEAVPAHSGSDYPPPYDRPIGRRVVRRLSEGAGITDFMMNHVTLHPGDWSSQRHWHEGEDEVLVMISGHVSLIDDSGSTVLGPGDCAAFPKDDGNGHHIVADRGETAAFVVLCRPEQGLCHYPDADLLYDPIGDRMLHKDGKPY